MTKSNKPKETQKNEKASLKKYLNDKYYKWYIGIFAILIGLIIAFPNIKSGIKDIIQSCRETYYGYSPKKFKESDDFKILILPFKRLEKQNEGTKEVEQAIFDRLNEIDSKNNLNLQVIYDEFYKGSLDEKVVKKIGFERKANIVLYGDFNETKNGYSSNIKYIFLQKDSVIMFNPFMFKDSVHVKIDITNTDMELNISDETDYQRFDNFSDISKGIIQNDIEEMIFTCFMFKAYYENNYERAFELSKNLKKRFANKDGALFEFQIECLSKINNLNLTYDYYSNLITLDSSMKGIWSNRGIVLKKMKKYNEALQDYDKAIKYNNNDGLAYVNRGNLYCDLNKYNEALSDYRKALIIDSKHFKVYQLMGETFLKQNRLEEAREVLYKALENKVFNSGLFMALGVLYKRLNLPDSSLVYLNKAVELNSNNSLIYFNRGIVYKDKLKIYEKAISDFSKAISLDTQYVEAYLQRASCYSELKNIENAAKDFSKALQLDSNNIQTIIHNRGYMYLENGLYDNALKDFNFVLSKNPNDAFAYNNRGLVYAYLGNFNSAFSDIEKSKFLNPKNSYVYKHLGLVYKLMGDIKKALEFFKIASKNSKELSIELSSEINSLESQIKK